MVKLIAMTTPVDITGDTNPVDVVETAACTCYNSKPDLCEHKVSHGCMKSGHLSVWEHISFTFKVGPVSRALLAQLSRHRHISLSVQSQRYVRVGDEAVFYVPAEVSKCNASKDKYVSAMESGIGQYAFLLKEYGIPLEDARNVLPQGFCTELVMTCNARALIEMSHKRLCTRAQKEIRDVFWEIKNELEKYCPEVARYMVPQCESSGVVYCPERDGCGIHMSADEINARLEKDE